MRILLTNDDGINAPGLRSLYHALTRAGHAVQVVAPARQQSGVGHSLTVFEPLRPVYVKEDDFAGIAIHGTPTDCVKLGLGAILPEQPELVISGINAGPNVGPDIRYSGTVGAATEAALADLPSLAVSHADYRPEVAGLRPVAEHVVSLVASIDWQTLPKRRVLNLNYPDCPLDETRGIRICPQSLAVWSNDYIQRSDPRGTNYWWLDGEVPAETIHPESDKGLLAKGYITMTPLQFDLTDHACLSSLEKLGL